MGVSDKFEASVHDDAGEPDETSEASAHPTDNGGVVPGAASAPEGKRSGVDTRRRRTKKSLEETEALVRRLEQAGFSRTEAGRLIFERLRPREEGLARS